MSGYQKIQVMEKPACNTLVIDNLSSVSIKLEKEEDKTYETECLFLPHVTPDRVISEHDDDYLLEDEDLSRINFKQETNENIEADNDHYLQIMKTEQIEPPSYVTEECIVNNCDINKKPLMKRTHNEDGKNCSDRPEERESVNSKFISDRTLENFGKDSSSESCSMRNVDVNNCERKYACNYCQLSFNYLSLLKRHRNIHIKEKQYICNFCQKSYSQSINLKIHLNTHTKEKEYVCNVCQKTFSRNSHLKEHLNTHTKEKLFVCDFCQKSFSRNSNLKVHLNIHTKEKKYICNICLKSFHSNSDLIKHLNIHTKEKKYVCNFCQKSFDRTSNLKLHLNTHTKKQKYDCNDCKKTFLRKSNFMRHINRIHKDINN
ncbi:uncharacterized protein LOC142333616 isoform X2 [Lycorma delicatula]|uniref:uncharacterized protein LOC142333616 isoform X2 n=1 Tax=Lycorma delicatula TaxID=130591 RepID=UPI003F516E97